MALSSTQIITDVRYLLNEPTAKFWSDTELNLWLSRAALDISSKTRCYQKTDIIITASGTRSYPRPTDFIRSIAAVDETNNVALIPIHPRKIGDAEGTTVTTFYEWGSDIGFDPIPSSALTVNLLYAAETDEITDLPDAFHWSSVLFVTAFALNKDQRYADASVLHAQYLQNLAFYRQDLITPEVVSRSDMKVADRLG